MAIVSLVKLECVLSSPRQRQKSRIKRNVNLDFSIATQFLFDQLKIAESTKLGNMKGPITCPFQAQFMVVLESWTGGLRLWILDLS